MTTAEIRNFMIVLRKRSLVVGRWSPAIISLTFSFHSFSRRARWRPPTSCQCGGPGRLERGNRKCQRDVRAGGRPTCYPNLREHVDDARTPLAEGAAIHVPPP